MVSDRITTADFGRGRRAAVDPPPYYRHQHRRTRWLLILLPVFAIFVGFGSIVWLAYVEGAPASAIGEPPLIKADARPIKLAPDDPGGREVPDQGEVDELLAGGRAPSGTERLLPPPEEPMVPPSPEELAAAAEDLGDEVADASEGQPAGSATGAAPGTTGGAGEQAAAAGAGQGDAGAAAPQDAERAIRQLFQNEPEARRSAASDQPREAPQVLRPEPSRQATADAAAEETSSPQVAGATAGPDARTGSSGRDGQSGDQASQASSVPDRPARTQPPAPRETTTAVRTTPAIAPANRLAAPASDVSLEGPHFRVQLAAVRNEADAQRAWDLFRADYGDVLAGVEPIFERGETSNGVFYRVQLGPYAELNRAERLCEELKQRNASCFVLRR